MALKEEYSEYDCKMMELAGFALVKASRANDLLTATAIFAATPPKFRDDLRDFAIWLEEAEGWWDQAGAAQETLH